MIKFLVIDDDDFVLVPTTRRLQSKNAPWADKPVEVRSILVSKQGITVTLNKNGTSEVIEQFHSVDEFKSWLCIEASTSTVVVTDNNMPGINGLQIMELLLSLETVPIIMQTTIESIEEFLADILVLSTTHGLDRHTEKYQKTQIIKLSKGDTIAVQIIEKPPVQDLFFSTVAIAIDQLPQLNNGRSAKTSDLVDKTRHAITSTECLISLAETSRAILGPHTHKKANRI